MTPPPSSAFDWEGQKVLDRDGEKIGTIEEIFLVEETGRPEWALVKIGRIKGHTTLVPLTRADPVDDGVKIPFEKGVVSEAPAVAADDDPSEQQVNALYRHYGIDPAEHTNGGASGSANGASASHEGNGGGAMNGGSVEMTQPATQIQPAAPPAEGPSETTGHDPGDLRDAPIGEVVNRVKDDASTLVSQELRLAKAEMSGKAKDIGLGAGMAGGAGYVAYLASIAFMLTLIFALAEVMPQWTAALIVTVLLAAVAGVLALKAKKKIQEAGPPIPEQTVESVKQTIE
ncbi:MAG TPA: phage holin family protein, partial [Solirubrobacteraceae bacterium]|nr:phage holin family protein [Solirubrobacteraceae bacterium]